jgi:hypothetical protein
LFERQLHIVDLEASKLQSTSTNFTHLLEVKKFDELPS